MLGIIVFLSTIAYIPHSIFVLGPVYYLIASDKSERTNFVSKKLTLNTLIISLIVLLSLLNSLLGFTSDSNLSQLFPYTALMFLGYFFAKTLKTSDLKIIIFLISIESIIVIAQHFMEINTFFPELIKETSLPSQINEDLLYYNRALGLSTNSSVAALKFLLGFILIDYLKLNGKLFVAIKTILFVGLFYTFNRTVLAVLIAYLVAGLVLPILEIITDLLEYRIKKKSFLVALFGGLFLILFMLLVIMKIDVIITQITLDKGMDLSGRELIWADFIQFIKENLLFGNHSSKYYFADYYSGPIHAHNSFLQIMANHGIIITLLFLLLILVNITKKNVMFVFTLLLYSLFQYGVFWGISITDIVLFIILFRQPEDYTWRNTLKKYY